MTRRRDRVVVEGPDTWPFLQSLLSQDLDGIAEGERRATLLLTPRGKVESVAGVTRRGDAAVLDTDPGWGEELAAALGRYKIRTKVDLVVEAAPAADDATVAAEEAERIAAGRPGLGTELDDTVIPQEAFLERDAVSFTKGCFVGQELVCRIDTRGHVNRYLRHVVTEDAAAVLAPGSTVVVDGAAVGTITSSAPGRAFAFVRHEVEPPHPATVDGVPVTVAALDP